MPYVNRMTEVVIMYRRPTTELHPMEENEALAKEDPGLFRSIVVSNYFSFGFYSILTHDKYVSFTEVDHG